LPSLYPEAKPASVRPLRLRWAGVRRTLTGGKIPSPTPAERGASGYKRVSTSRANGSHGSS
jgi:hypothetical protein